jgi:pseudomonalisin
MHNPASPRAFLAALLLLAGCLVSVHAQNPVSRVVRAIDESQVETLYGNVHTMARAEFDQGTVEAETPLNKLVLQLEPSAAQQSELNALVQAQHNPQSPLYHKWLTPAQYGARFGASEQDVAKITSWLKNHGFTVDEIPASHRQVIFSGTVGQVEDTFHTELHQYRVNGESHVANSQDPQIPAALSGVVSGIVSLHSFRRTSAIQSRTAIGERITSARPQYSNGSTHYLSPADWATIYDLNSLYSAGTNGAGVSIAVVGRSNINLSDVNSFRSATGLKVNPPTVILVNSNPGLVSGDQDESTLDVEWAGATAPSATVKFVVAASTRTTDGIDLSAQYIVNHATAPIMTTSYGSCESAMGAAERAFYNSLWQQAASEGISSFVSSGDSGAAGCSSGSATSASGTGVNGMCSSPYATCVGGTEFNEGSNYLQYWSASNSSSYGSALSYIPEVVWNESGSNSGSGLWATGGGASLYYTQPSWQKGVSGASASNGMRAVPDVSMTASGHDGYIIEENGTLYIISGTSASSPAFAGLMALVVQSKGGTGVGNANAGLYPLVNASKNPFHPTPSGNNSVPGVTGFTASGATYNLATGLGSVDGALLVSSWGSGSSTSSVDFVLKSSATSGSVLAGKTTTFTLSATETGTGKNAIALTASAPAGVTVSFSAASINATTASTVTITVAATATAGAKSIVITGKDSTGTQTATYTLTVTKTPTLTLTGTATSISLAQGKNGIVSLAAATGGSFSGSIAFAVSGLPTGVTAVWSPASISSVSGATTNAETLTLTASTTAKAGSTTLTLTATGGGLTSSKTITLQVVAVPTLTVTPVSNSLSLAPKGAVTDVINLARNSLFSGTITLAVSGLPTGVTATWNNNPISLGGLIGASTLTLTASATAAAGKSTITLKATGGGLTVTQNLSLTVTAPATLTVTPAVNRMTVYNPAQAASASQTTARQVITFTGGGPFKGSVSLSASGLPASLTASWSCNSVTMNSSNVGTSTLTVTAGATGSGTVASTVAPGTYTLTVTAAGGGLTATKTIQVQVAGGGE